MPLDNEAIKRIVMAYPIPDRLIRDLGNAPLVRRPRKVMRPRMNLHRYETLKLIACGYSNAQVAGELGVTVETARSYAKELYDYFDMTGPGTGLRCRLVSLCFRERIV